MMIIFNVALALSLVVVWIKLMNLERFCHLQRGVINHLLSRVDVVEAVAKVPGKEWKDQFMVACDNGDNNDE